MNKNGRLKFISLAGHIFSLLRALVQCYDIFKHIYIYVLGTKRKPRTQWTTRSAWTFGKKIRKFSFSNLSYLVLGFRTYIFTQENDSQIFSVSVLGRYWTNRKSVVV
jgi:hypothetical protein